MKKIIILLISLFAYEAMAAYGRVGASTAKKYDGTVDATTREAVFINVLNKYGATIASGKVAVWDSSNDDGGSVTLSATAFSTPACMMVKDCAANAMCKCQKYGYTDLLLFSPYLSGSASAGDKIQLSEDTAGYVQAPSSLEARDTVIGMFYDAASTTGAVEAFLTIP